MPVQFDVDYRRANGSVEGVFLILAKCMYKTLRYVKKIYSLWDNIKKKRGC